MSNSVCATGLPVHDPSDAARESVEGGGGVGASPDASASAAGIVEEVEVPDVEVPPNEDGQEGEEEEAEEDPEEPVEAPVFTSEQSWRELEGLDRLLFGEESLSGAPPAADAD